MNYDYMCSDCGIEYTTQVGIQEKPEPKCPSCGSTDHVPVLLASTHGNTYGSWESNDA